ncbi:KRAB domain-containing zinc finger protein [Mytilus galloprovincialis]|uniref:KRAB domain-containing zinc finger protein n=1 Tax=Mytilus galloprovincialis TaxID=29158 RepID=A0A8B6GKM1_MYTGA|nr:KRAB domain-containing zinc finger protein [Mytilus galloprovincialis]
MPTTPRRAAAANKKVEDSDGDLKDDQKKDTNKKDATAEEVSDGNSRGLGRPKKDLSTPNKDAIDEEEETSTDSTRKRQGRTKKDILVPETTETPERRGRGRSRKDTPGTPAVKDSEESKKGRGRPKKNEEKDGNDEIGSPSDEKRGRGRPKKDLNDTDTTESDLNSGSDKERIEVTLPGRGTVIIKSEPDDTFHMSTRRKTGFSCECGQSFSVEYLLEDHQRRCKKAETGTPNVVKTIKKEPGSATSTPKARTNREKAKETPKEKAKDTPKEKPKVTSKEKSKETPKEKPRETPRRKPELKANINPKSGNDKAETEISKDLKKSEPSELEKDSADTVESSVKETNDSDNQNKSEEKDIDTPMETILVRPPGVSKEISTPVSRSKATEVKKILVVTPEGLKRQSVPQPAVLKVEKKPVTPSTRVMVMPKPKSAEKKVVVLMGTKETEVSIDAIDDDKEEVELEAVTYQAVAVESQQEPIIEPEESSSNVEANGEETGDIKASETMETETVNDGDVQTAQQEVQIVEVDAVTGQVIVVQEGQQKVESNESAEQVQVVELEASAEKMALLQESLGLMDIPQEPVEHSVEEGSSEEKAIEEKLEVDPSEEGAKTEEHKDQDEREEGEVKEGDDDDEENEEDEEILDDGALDGKRKITDDETWTPLAKRIRRSLATPATGTKIKSSYRPKKQPKNALSLLSEAAKKTMEKAKEENVELDPVQLKIFESLVSVAVKDEDIDEDEEDDVMEVRVIKQEESAEGIELDEDGEVAAVIYNDDEEALVDISVIESMVDLESAECGICFMKFKNSKYMRNHLVTHTGNKKFTCEVCSKRFMRKYDLQQHMMRVHSFIKAARGKIISSEEELLASNSEADLKTCQYCQTHFTTQFMLDAHLEEKHSEERPFECPVCQSKFPTQKKLVRHKDSVHSERQHQCEHCEKSFRFLYALKEHEKTHNEAKPFLCDDCGKGFALAKYLQKHKQRHTAPEVMDKVYNCRYCDKTFDNLHEYQQHIRTHTEAEDRIFQCDQCPKRFFKQAHLKRHIMTHSTVRCYECTYCAKAYKDPDTLRKHIRFIHKSAEEDGNRKEYPCPFCDKVFYSNGHRKRHLIKHTGERPFKCEECGKGFTEKRSLQNHQRIHSGERPYSCKICGKAFIQLSHLNRHTFLHTQIRNFECEECGKKFFENADLQKHQRIHSKDKPYKCEFCGIGFSQPNILKCHRRRHTGEKPYVCDICNRAFIQMGALQTHRRLHTGERPFKCSYCGQGFVSKERMKFHTYIHTGITPHICHICGKGFRLKFKLQSHLDSHEGVYRYQCKICNKGFLEKTKLNRHIKQIHDDPSNPDTDSYIENNIRIIQRPDPATPKFQIVELHPDDEATTTHVIVEDDTLRNFSEIAVNSMSQPAANEEVIETTQTVPGSYEIQTSEGDSTNAVQHIQFDSESGEITASGGTTLFDGTTTINLPEGIIYEGMENGEEVVYVVIPEDNQTVILS